MQTIPIEEERSNIMSVFSRVSNEVLSNIVAQITDLSMLKDISLADRRFNDCV